LRGEERVIYREGIEWGESNRAVGLIRSAHHQSRLDTVYSITVQYSTVLYCILYVMLEYYLHNVSPIRQVKQSKIMDLKERLSE
jgi:hypothetical protein